MDIGAMYVLASAQPKQVFLISEQLVADWARKKKI
jgi:hypothetical protein